MCAGRVACTITTRVVKLIMFSRSATRVVNQEPAFVSAADNSDSDQEHAAYAGDDMQQQLQPMGVEIDPNEHITESMFNKVQKVILDFDVTASPAEMAADASKRIWQLKSQLRAQLKQNLAKTDRATATEDQLAGNLQRCIPLNMRIMQQSNSFPYAMGIEIEGMMNTNLHRDGSCVWRVPPNTPTMKVDEIAFAPNNLVTAHMYSNYKMCTLEDLDNDIKAIAAVPSKNVPAHALVASGSLAHTWLKKNLVETSHWDAERPHLDIGLIMDTPDTQHYVQVTARMGTELRDMLRGPITEAANSFIDLDAFNVRFVRADGNPSFVTPKGINGDIASNRTVKADKIRSDKMELQSTIHIKAELAYILF